MTRVCVIINDLGGIPHTLHKNVVSQHGTWSQASQVGLALPSTDRAEGFHGVTRGTSSESIFSVVSSRGIATVLAGPACGMRRRPDPESVADPEASLAYMGIDRCSPYDDASLVGASSVYDVDTLRYAADAVNRPRVDGGDGGAHLLLWVNLLALRDVNHVRSVTARGHRVDRRGLPESLHAVVPHSTDAVMRDFYAVTTRPAVRDAESEFAALLEHSSNALQGHLERVRRFVLHVLERCPDAHVLHTASHSLALGEHGMRGGTTPMSTACTTFVASRPAASADCRNLDALLCNFVLDAFHIPHPVDLGAPVTRVPSLGMTRTLVWWNDHRYAVIERNGSIQHVFDLSTDPFELEDVVSGVTHLHKMLRPTTPSTLPPPAPTSSAPTSFAASQSPPSPPPRPAPVSVPSPSSSDVSSASSLARKTSFSRRAPATASQNVRRAEQRLSSLRR